MTKESLLLKWGTLKGWGNASEETQERLRRYHEQPVSMGCATQDDTPEQKEIICEIIDGIDGEIQNDWTGEIMSKDEAKKYVREYGAR